MTQIDGQNFNHSAAIDNALSLGGFIAKLALNIDGSAIARTPANALPEEIFSSDKSSLLELIGKEAKQ